MILFRGSEIVWQNVELNDYLDITNVVKEVSKYGLLDYNRIPQELYIPWKILVLGTNEYNEKARWYSLNGAVEYIKQLATI